ncbi:MAG: hypothetical protein OXH96_13195 [Spirochaetaceae bacterium]|nr:hypothetical protein [Spirochaetaceae bacterium]
MVWIETFAEDIGTLSDTRLILLTTNTAADGSALSKLRKFDNDRDTNGAIDLLVSAATNSKNQSTKSAREAFLSLDTTTRRVLVENIWVFDNAGTIINVREEIEGELRYFVSDKVCTFTDYLEGWWFNRLIVALTDPSQAAIPIVAISSKIFEIQESFRRDNLPLDESIDAMPPVTVMPKDERVFVRQMNLVKVSEQEILIAIHDFYRASAQRSRWARENLLLDGEVARYERALHDAWRRCFYRCIADVDSASDEGVKQDVGKEVFQWACEYRRALRNRDEIWLSSGSFQILADALRVGWHPDFAALVRSGGGDK